MFNDNFNWFDEKFKEGGKPTLEDKAELFKNLRIHLSSRNKREIEEIIKSSLHNLKKQYSPAWEVIAFNFINCFSPMILDEITTKKYQQQYKKIVEKYKDRSVFKKNYF